MNKVKKNLLNASKNGNFLKVAYEAYSRHSPDRQSVGKEIAILHNEGAIDAIAEFRQLSRNFEGVNFFSARHIFEDVLPELNAPVASVMDCVKHLVAEAGDDMTAKQLFTPFVKYCEADRDRAKEVLQIVERSGGEWIDFVSPAIIAGSNLRLSEYVPIAIKYTHHENLKVKAEAVFTLGKINYCNNSSLLTDALEALKSVIHSEDDDRLRGSAIKSAFSLYVADNDIENDVTELTKVALTQNGEETIHAASELFGLEKDKIPDALLDVLLSALKNTKPQNKGTLNYIDYGLQDLLKKGQEEKAISFLEHLLVQNYGELSIDVFNSLTYDLYTDNKPMLNKLTTRWFLSKKIPLCRAVMDIVRLCHEKNLILFAETDQFVKLPEESCLFVARKAIGWLFTNPVSCTSFIMSLIDVAGDNEVEQITDLLFNPLLISV